ncbi:MAG: hypothetical protein SFX18_03380 [Pirellulales bacterium]|nr:hypothetical protein [Pirellulales bacterium]
MDNAPPPPRWQFSISTVLLVFAGFAAILAIVQSPFSLPLAMVGLVASLIAAHVAGNGLGVHLRDHSELQRRELPPAHAVPLQRPDAPGRLLQTYQIRPPERLSVRSTPHLGIAWGAGAGTLAGGTLGGWLLWDWSQGSFSGWILGCASAAVIGGILTFILTSFLWMSYVAWREATRER